MSNSRVSTFGKLTIAALAAIAFFPSALPAYLDTLSDEDVINAYNIGQRRDQDFVKFLHEYETGFGGREVTVHVGRIAVRTPFAIVVEQVFQKGSTYPMFQARLDFVQQSIPFAVIVDVYGQVPSNPGMLSDADSGFWKQFAFVVSQKRDLAPRTRHASPLYSTSGNYTFISGGEMRFEYDVGDVASDTIHITVNGPGSATASTEFDLDKLR